MPISSYPKHLSSLGYDSTYFELRNLGIVDFPIQKEKGIWVGKIEYEQSFVGIKNKRNIAYNDLTKKEIEIIIVEENNSFKLYFGNIKVLSTKQWKEKRKLVRP